MEIDYRGVDPSRYKNTKAPRCEPGDCSDISMAMKKAERPLVVIGAGAAEPGITDAIGRFLQKTKVPYAAAPMAKNFVDEFNPSYLGVLRVRMQEWEMNWYDDSLVKGACLAQVDPDPEEIGRVYPVDLSAVGSISSFLEQDDQGEHRSAPTLQQELEALASRFPRQKRYQDGKGLHPLNLNNIIEDMADRDAIVACDTGYAKSMAIMKFRTRREQTFLVAENNGPMGYALPASLGAALATGREVICFIGDGGIQMSINELGTALNYGLKVIFILQNNKGCASMVDFHEFAFGRHCAAVFDNPEFTDIARAYGMKGYKVNDSAGLEVAFTAAKSDSGSVIIEAEIDQGLMIWE
jgi:acetolactate synthase-1/2/3 large subunit